MASGNWIALLGVVAGLIAFVNGLLQYARAQRWKRVEFVAKEVKEFESNPDSKMAMQMLDWNVRSYELFPEKEPEKRKVKVDDDILSSALVPHVDKPFGFSEAERRIREIFDQFLDALDRFEHFIQSRLVTRKEFRPYLIYWIEMMGDMNNPRKPKKFRRSLWKYIDFYGFSGVQRLFGRYGYNIHPPRDEPVSG
jgi:hypothetical protein